MIVEVTGVAIEAATGGSVAVLRVALGVVGDLGAIVDRSVANDRHLAAVVLAVVHLVVLVVVLRVVLVDSVVGRVVLAVTAVPAATDPHSAVAALAVLRVDLADLAAALRADLAAAHPRVAATIDPVGSRP